MTKAKLIAELIAIFVSAIVMSCITSMLLIDAYSILCTATSEISIADACTLAGLDISLAELIIKLSK